MTRPIEVKYYQHQSISDPQDDRVTLAATFHQDDMLSPKLYAEFLYQRIGELVAERYVAEHYAELVAKLDPQAIANLAIADAGKKIAEEIRTRPVVYREKTNNHFSLL